MTSEMNGLSSGGGTTIYDETHSALPQTIDIGFKWSEIYLIGSYAGTNACLFYSKKVFSDKYIFKYNNGSQTVQPNVGDASSGGILSVTDNGVVFTSGGAPYWTNVRVVAIPDNS